MYVFLEHTLCSWCGFQVKIVHNWLLFVVFPLQTLIATCFPWKIISIIYTISFFNTMFFNTIAHTLQVNFLAGYFCKWCIILTYRKVKRPHLYGSPSDFLCCTRTVKITVTIRTEIGFEFIYLFEFIYILWIYLFWHLKLEILLGFGCTEGYSLSTPKNLFVTLARNSISVRYLVQLKAVL